MMMVGKVPVMKVIAVKIMVEIALMESWWLVLLGKASVMIVVVNLGIHAVDNSVLSFGNWCRYYRYVHLGNRMTIATLPM